MSMSMSRASLLMLALCAFPATLLAETPATTGYAMYVWTTGFDATVSGCDEVKLIAWDKTGDPQCYTHTWDTPAGRQWLWDTCNRAGHEVRSVFVSDIKLSLQPGHAANDCSDPSAGPASESSPA